MHRVNDDEIEGETLESDEFKSEERLPEKGREREKKEK